MKKYLVLLTIILFSLLMINESSGAFNYIDPIEVNTNNLKDYLKNNNYDDIRGFCSYDYCYEIREDDIEKSIMNFKKIYNKYLTDDERLIVDIKGYPITRIILE